MKEVDCRMCKNLIDKEKGCKLYGSNADEAVKKCADNNFRRYRIKYDKRTQAWFAENILEMTTVEQCKECGLFYKPSLGHECEVKGDKT